MVLTPSPVLKACSCCRSAGVTVYYIGIFATVTFPKEHAESDVDLADNVYFVYLIPSINLVCSDKKCMAIFNFTGFASFCGGEK